MQDFYLQPGVPHPGDGVNTVMVLAMLVPALMILAGTWLGFQALSDIKSEKGALGGAVMAALAAGLLPATIIVIVCGGGLTLLAEEFVRGPRARSGLWPIAGGAAGLWLSFVMMRAMHRTATGWVRPARTLQDPARNALAAAAIVLTIVGAAILLVILTVPPERHARLFDSRSGLVYLDLAVLLGGLICGVLGRRERAASVCAWICGSLFVFLLIMTS
jgi:hypothetical protein